MTSMFERKGLSWTKRVALVRHNLHAASRTGDNTFFKSLQAASFLEGTDHVALLAAALDNEADSVLHGLDDLNAGMAYIHQDSYKAVYDGIRSSFGEEIGTRRAKLRVDISQQKQIADFGIAKIVNCAIALIEAQPPHCQECVATVWIMGTTIIADAVQVCITQMDKLESMLDDFILLEYSWQTVQTAVEASVSALRGVFDLMASSESNGSVSSASAAAMCDRSRTASVSSATSSIFKRLSAVLGHGFPAGPPSSTRNSVSFGNPLMLRNSISAACPTAIPALSSFTAQPQCHKRTATDPAGIQRKLSPIPPTPGPFTATPDVNPFDMSFKSSPPHHHGFNIDQDMVLDEASPSPLDADPLGTPLGTPGECKAYGFVPPAFRRMSTAFGPQPIPAV